MALGSWRADLQISICVALVLFAVSAPVHAELPSDRYEPGGLPFIAADPDVGLKFGGFGQLTAYHRERRPFAWQSQLFVASSVRNGAMGTEFPYREVTFRLDWPHALFDHLRLTLEAQYVETTNYGYYGLGNASHAEQLWSGLSRGSDEYVRARHFYQFDGISPGIRLWAREAIAPAWSRFWTVGFSRTVIHPYAGSLLARDITSAPGAAALHGTGDANRLVVGFGFAFDTRDHEIVTTRGQFHDLAFRFVPGTPGADAYLGATATLRGYVPIEGEKLSIAARIVADALTRNAPLLELSQYGGLYGGQGPGGARGVRGIPQGRLLGRTKLIGSVEVRSLFLPFTIGTQRFTLGATAFFDAGRVWTDTLASVPSLDGSPWKIHWGTGGGPRLRWGDALVIRADIAYAPLGAALGMAPGLYLDFKQAI